MAIEIQDPMKVEALRHKLRIALKTGDWRLQVRYQIHVHKSSFTYINELCLLKVRLLVNDYLNEQGSKHLKYVTINEIIKAVAPRALVMVGTEDLDVIREESVLIMQLQK